MWRAAGWVLLVGFLGMVWLPPWLWAAEADVGTAPRLPAGAFRLTVDGPLLSLQAHEASLRAVLEALGRQLDIEVVAHLSYDLTLTLAFDRLSLADALDRCRAYANIISVHDPSTTPATMRRMLVIPIQTDDPTGTPAHRSHTETSQPDARPPTVPHAAPFRFDFDPGQDGQQRQ